MTQKERLENELKELKRNCKNAREKIRKENMPLLYISEHPAELYVHNIAFARVDKTKNGNQILISIEFEDGYIDYKFIENFSEKFF